MLKAKKLRTAFLFLPFVFCLSLSGVSVADDSCFQGLSTIPGNPEYPDKWRDPYQPKIYSDNDEIARNNYVDVWVYSEGRACPTYSWSVSGTGFHFDSASGPTTATTNADLETLQLWADSTACGSTTITVTDLCEGNDEGFVRCTTGQWVEIPFTSCIISGAITEGDGKTRIQDKWKLVEIWGVTCSSTGLACQNNNPAFGLCEAPNYYGYCNCLDPGDCHTTMGCTQCLEHGGICNNPSYPIECFSPSDCLCCMGIGGTCTGLGVPSVVMCSKQNSKLYEWTCLP